MPRHNRPTGQESDWETLPVKKNRSKKNLKKQIASIYAGSNPEMTLPPSGGRKTKFLVLLVVVLAFLAATSWLGFFLFGQGQKFSEDKIKLSLEGPKEIINNSEIIYKINYFNKSKTPLTSSFLSLRYPDGFKFISASVTPRGNDNKEWDLGTIMPGDQGTLEVKGQLWGEAEREVSLRAFLNYQPANLSAEFQKSFSLVSRLKPLPLDLALEGPAEASNAENINLQIKIKNTGEKNIDANLLKISLILPPGFKFISSSAKLDKNNLWSLGFLKQGETTTTLISLIPTAEVQAGAQTIKAEFFLTAENRLYKQKTVEKNINIAKSDLLLQLAANGSDEKQVVNFGDKVSFTAALENTGNTAFKNASLRLVLDTPSTDNKSLFDWSLIEDKHDGDISGEQISPAIRRAVITWNKKHISALALIKPNDKITFDLTLPIKSKTALDLIKLNEFKTTAFLEITAGQAAAAGSSALQSNNLSLILNSDLNVSLQAAFKESRDLLPTIGKNKFDSKNIFSFTWTINNSLHELADLQLTATLPEYVDWESVFSASAGDITFDETAKQVIWKLNRLPTSFPQATITFDLGLKSKETDKGQEVILIDKTRVEAQDKITGENLLFWKDPVITVL